MRVERAQRVRVALLTQRGGAATVRDLVRLVGGIKPSAMLAVCRAMEGRAEVSIRKVRRRVLCRDGRRRWLELCEVKLL